MQVSRRTLLRNFILELVLYGVLVIAYFFLILQSIGVWLTELYYTNLNLYAVVALALIVVQGLFLEMVTSFLIERLGLERLE